MPEPTVMLRLNGAGPDDRLRAWVEALGRSTSGGRHLALHDSASLPPDLAEWCAASGVDPREATARPDVLVVASAADLPTPGAVRRLVSAASHGGTPLETRALPFGAGATSADADPVAATTVCVALPGPTPEDLERATTPTAAASVAVANGRPVRRLDAAAVFVDRRPDVDASPPPPSTDAEAPPPYGHPAALPATPLHQLLLHTGVTPPPLPQHQPDRPFLTVITRTQGTRLLCLEEVLTCLAGQSTRDFELVLTCHRAADADAERVGALLEQLPGWLRAMTTVLRVDRPGRASPLNDALAVARGRYAVALDDDDTVTADWVATFEALESTSPGTVLRAGALRQDVVPVRDPEGGAPGDVAPREAGPAHPGWPAEFSMVEHLWDNASPFMTVAFPRGVFDDLGLRFDESLHTNEDWDFLVRAASPAGVSSSTAHTSVYRLWTESEGSRDVHDDATWTEARESLLARMDEQVVLLPAGAARDIRDLRRALQTETAEKFRFAALNEQAAADLVTVNEAVAALRARIAQLEERLERRRRRRHQPG